MKESQFKILLETLSIESFEDLREDGTALFYGKINNKWTSINVETDLSFEINTKEEIELTLFQKASLISRFEVLTIKKQNELEEANKEPTIAEEQGMHNNY